MRELKYFLLLVSCVPWSSSEEIRVAVSGYSSRIETLAFDTLTGNLTLLAEQEWETFISFLDLQGPDLYASHEVFSYEGLENQGGLSRWRLGQEDGLTWEKQEVSVVDKGKC